MRGVDQDINATKSIGGGRYGSSCCFTFFVRYALSTIASRRFAREWQGSVGKTVFVTGAAGGIGEVCAQRFLDEGANVVVADYDLGAG